MVNSFYSKEYVRVARKQVTVAQCHLSLRIQIETIVAKHITLIKMILSTKEKVIVIGTDTEKSKSWGHFGEM